MKILKSVKTKLFPSSSCSWILFLLLGVLLGSMTADSIKDVHAQEVSDDILTMDFEQLRNIALRAGLLLEGNPENADIDAEIASHLLVLPPTNQAAGNQVSGQVLLRHQRLGRLRSSLSRQNRLRVGNFVLRLQHEQQRQQQQSLNGAVILAYGVLTGPRPGIVNFQFPGLDFTGYAPAQDNRVRNLPSNDTLPMGSFLTGRTINAAGQTGNMRLFAWTLPVGDGGTAGIRVDFFERLRLSGRALLAKQLYLLVQTEGSVIRIPLGVDVYLVALTRIGGRLEVADSPLETALGSASLEAGAGIDARWSDTRGRLRIFSGPELVVQPHVTNLAPILNVTADIDM